MSFGEIMSIVMTVVSILATIIGYYYNLKSKLENEINGKIDEAEAEFDDGEDEMEYVVTELCKLIPAPYRGILNKNFIEKLVQKAFDKMESYAEKQVNKNTSK